MYGRTNIHAQLHSRCCPASHTQVERSVHEDLWNSLAGECTTERHHRQQLNTQLSYARTAKRKAQLQAEIAALSDESCTQFEKYFSSNTKGR